VRTVEHLDEGPGPPGAPRRGPSAQTVLFLHGLGGGAESWRPQLDALSPMVRCLAWSMPGYGRSRSLPVTTIASLAGAAVGLLDAVEVERAVVVGHSLGGFVAQELALSHPDRVERLVLVATTATLGAGPGSSWAEEFRAARLAPLDEGRPMTELARTVVPGLVGPDCPAPVVRAATKLMGSIAPAAYRAALDAALGWDGRERLATLAVPTLCLAGQLDSLTPPAAVGQLAELIADCRFVVLEGSGHLVPLERPEEVSRQLRSFLAWM
jgi:3-oxoadipate enol-lactonase